MEILKYVLPSVIVFITVYFVLKLFLDNQQKKQELEIKANTSKIIIPMRLQSFERLILLMERITPNNLIIRVHSKGFSAKQMQILLLQNIRNEFEHNLAQQMYVSSDAWQLILNAKEEMIKIINTSATKLNNDAKSHDLNTLILEQSVIFKKFPTIQAIEVLKKEVRELF